MSVIELSIVMPCLNEAKTLATVIRKAQTFLQSENIQGEIVIADNGSHDGSPQIATGLGVRLIHVEDKGYGAALMGGIREARGRYVIMGDADDSYDFSNLLPFVKKLRDGYDLVMGNRFKGGIEKGAMPALHRYLGNPVLSFIGRLFFKIKARDFHCGLRGFSREAILKLDLQTLGMEFASEMVVKSALAGYRITEVPTTLSPDGRGRPPHLRTWRDGWRHLRFLLMYSPKWLFLYPGFFLLAIGAGLAIPLTFVSIEMYDFVLDIHTLLFASFLILVGLQSVIFWFFTKIYAIDQGLLPKDAALDKLFTVFNLERGVWMGVLLLSAGIATWIYFFISWASQDFGVLNPRITMRVAIPSLTLIFLGFQLILYSFFFSILGLKKRKNEGN